MTDLFQYFLAADALAPVQITKVLLAIAVLLGLARLLGELCRQFQQPAVLGEIVAGILVGQTVLGSLYPELFAWLFPNEGPVFFADEGFITISATLLLLVVGLDVDLSTVWRQGRAAAFVSLLGVAAPMSMGILAASLLPEFFGLDDENLLIPFVIFVGIALSITALPVIAKILMDLNIAKSDLGMLILASAMLNDLVGWIGFAVVLALLANAQGLEGAVGGEGGGGPGVVMTILFTFGFLAFMLTAGRWMFHRALPWIQAHWGYPGGVLAFVFVVALVCAAATEWIGIHSIFGAFVAGVAMGDSHHLRERTRDTIHQFITNIFAPIFFASIGLRINFVDAFNLQLVLVVVAIACTGKIGGSYLGARIGKLSKREGWALSFGMAAQGAVGIILGQLARQVGLIDDELMVAIVIMALGTSIMSGPAMTRILRMKQQRKLKDVLTDRHIIINPAGQTVHECIRAMSQRAAQITGLDADTIDRDVWNREQMMHTGLPHGLAVPHARPESLAKPCLILGVSLRGVDFDSPDGERARIIGLLLTPPDKPESQIELLALFVQTFDAGEVRQDVLQAETPTEVLAALNLATSESEATATHDTETLGMKD